MARPALSRATRAVQACLTDELRKKEYRGHPNRFRGHCYVASEAIFHLLGGKRAGWVAARGKPNPRSPEVHWWLENTRTGQRVDATALQFARPVPYAKCGRNAGFLTRKPSARAGAVMRCARKKLRRR